MMALQRYASTTMRIFKRSTPESTIFPLSTLLGFRISVLVFNRSTFRRSYTKTAYERYKKRIRRRWTDGWLLLAFGTCKHGVSSSSERGFDASEGLSVQVQAGDFGGALGI